MTTLSILCLSVGASIGILGFIVAYYIQMKRLHTQSQNFLRSPVMVKGLVSSSTIGANDTVYDIGAGSGIITSALAPVAKKVIAVEYDQRIAQTLKTNTAQFSNVEVRMGDFLNLPLPKTAYKIFANPPFHISSAIVRRCINPGGGALAPEAMYLIVQRQFGKKLIATDTSHFTGQLGMIVGVEYKVKILKNLQKTDFWPHPAVDTVFVEFLRRKEPLVAKDRLAAYIRYTEECFSDPKKLNKLPLQVIGGEKGMSPSRLSLERWVLLFNNQKVY